MPKFMVILHNPPDVWKNVPPKELEQKMVGYQTWMNEIRSSGRYVSGEKLLEEGGKRLTRQRGKLSAIDGPYSEVKEVVGGYFVFRAVNYAEAVEFMRGCPMLDDCRIEIRQTDPMGCGGE